MEQKVPIFSILCHLLDAFLFRCGIRLIIEAVKFPPRYKDVCMLSGILFFLVSVFLAVSISIEAERGR